MPPPKHCATLATHLWSQGANLHLSLPTSDGWLEVLRYWQCQRCRLQTWATGAIERSTKPLSPLQWEARADWQQASGDLYGQVAKAQEQWQKQHAWLSRRLQAGAKGARR